MTDRLRAGAHHLPTLLRVYRSSRRRHRIALLPSPRSVLHTSASLHSSDAHPLLLLFACLHPRCGFVAMVLAELGSKIQSALAKMGQATVIDEKVLEDLVSRTHAPHPTHPITPRPFPLSLPMPSPTLSSLPLSPRLPLPRLCFPPPRSRLSLWLCCRPTWMCSW